MDCNVQPPRFVGTIAAPVPIRLPAVSAYRFASASVSSGSRSVILEKANTVVLERVTTATDVDGDYSQTDIYYHTAEHALVRTTKTETLPSGIIINCSNEVNYYHWMIDALAQLQFCEELPAAYADHPILISATSQKMEAVRSMIESIAPRRRMVFLKNLCTYVVTDLLYISQPNNMLPHLRHGSCYEARYAFARPESVLFLREKGLHLSRAIDTSNRPRRIILARRGSLRQYNQEELISMGQSYGFSPIYLEDMPFAEQVAIVANATMIIGPSGAAWTNLLFASSEARGLCWAAAEQGDASCFSNLAAIVGMKLDHLAYAGGTDNTRFLHSRAYQLDISKVETWMNATIIEMEGRRVPS
jgi:capsular polysaccharide biosynthesis protein